MRMRGGWLLLLMLQPMHAQQRQPAEPKYADPIQMHVADVDDTYEVYSAALNHELKREGKPAGHEANSILWLIDETTTAFPVNKTCMTDVPDNFYNLPVQQQLKYRHIAGAGYPQAAVMPPESSPDSLRAFKQMVQDFELYCHDRFVLESNHMSALHYQLMSASDFDEYQMYQNDLVNSAQKRELSDVEHQQAAARAEKFDNARGVYSFSRVYFNPEHTLAMTYESLHCGALCGHGNWVVVEKVNGNWVQAEWSISGWVS